MLFKKFLTGNQNINNDVAEKKIINGDISPSLANELKINNNGNNAQTAFINRVVPDLPNESGEHVQIPSKFLKPDSTKDKSK